MNIDFSGFIKAGVTPYIVLDTGDVINSTSDGLSVFDSVSVGSVVSRSTKTSEPSLANIIESIPNNWSSQGLGVNTYLEIINDYGFSLQLKASNSTPAIFASDGVVPVYRPPNNSYHPRMTPSSEGAIAVNINLNGGTNSKVTTVIERYSSGVVRFLITYTSWGDIYIQVDPDGTLFFFIIGVTKDPVVNTVGANSVVLTHVGKIKTNKLYCIRSFVANASGTVYNAAGGVAPNCSVMAFNRVSGRIVGKTKTNTSGTYSVNCVANSGDRLFMVCLDDDGTAPDFDAQIIDRILV